MRHACSEITKDAPAGAVITVTVGRMERRQAGLHCNCVQRHVTSMDRVANRAADRCLLAGLLPQLVAGDEIRQLGLDGRTQLLQPGHFSWRRFRTFSAFVGYGHADVFSVTSVSPRHGQDRPPTEPAIRRALHDRFEIVL
ncbi:MAG: hypothetical protein EBZ74_11075 [Planctomycetia bacterium]|nr:hypothetical protein [Planctomycetia bacterium]